jgi:RNA polymerase sigma factor (sigma-70 family)
VNGIEEIIDLCKKNNRDAQGRMFALLAPSLLGICRRYLGSIDEAEDAMQDSFVKIFSSLNKFKGDGSFEGWAKRIAVNTSLDVLRRKKRIRFERNLSIVETYDFSEEENDQLDIKEIMSCLEELPVGYRTVLNLHLVEGFSHREIGEQLGIQESTSRSQFARARQQLLRKIKERTLHISIKNA